MQRRLGILLAFGLLLALAVPAHAGSLGPQVIGMFPKDVGEFAYADMREARQQPWFNQVKDQMLPERFRQFEQFLASAGMDPNTQVQEMAWAVSRDVPNAGEQLVGVALGQFQPASLEAFFKAQKLNTTEVRGYTLFAFGSGSGPGDIFFFFLDSNTAAFGHRAFLEKLIGVRFGEETSLLRDEKLYPLISEVNGRGMVWAVLNQSYAHLAVRQLVPDVAALPNAPELLKRLKGLTISVQASRGVDARFQALCATPEDANLFAAAIQAGLLYRRHQEQQNNPELAKALDSAQVMPRGDRLEIRLALDDNTISTLLRRNTFVFVPPAARQ